MVENRARKKSLAQNKFAKTKKNTSNKQRSNLKTKKANNFVQVWVPIVKKPVSTAILDSTANRNSAAATNTTANKDSASTSINIAKHIILTKKWLLLAHNKEHGLPSNSLKDLMEDMLLLIQQKVSKVKKVANTERCQETKGIEGASARQKISTKRSKDPSKISTASSKLVLLEEINAAEHG
ncbi:hypothetical protein L6452_43859 [Arctium lappa]|uniref:Uncharacterized protein n=1 Tax=Arctium lappa TaxID=4217 RepID=A0ACB8XFA7_ARCLA|nr:hypothetical protein L6452_43859 [Arctium lappa]